MFLQFTFTKEKIRKKKIIQFTLQTMIVLHRRFLPQPHPSPHPYTVAIAEGRVVPQSGAGAEALPRVQMVRVAGSPAPKSSGAVPLCAGDSAQQLYLQGGQLLLQGRSCFITGGI